MRSVERRLTIIDHHDGRFAHAHINALFAEYLHIGNGNGLVLHLKCFFPYLGVGFGAHANVTRIFPAWIIDAPALDAGRGSEYVEQSGDDSLCAFAVLQIRPHKFLDRSRQAFRRDLRHTFARDITRLIAHTHADEGAQSSELPSSVSIASSSRTSPTM